MAKATKKTATKKKAAPTDADLDALLNEIENDDAAAETDVDDVLASVETEEAKQAAYEEQTSDGDVTPDAVEKKKSKPKAKAPRAPAFESAFAAITAAQNAGKFGDGIAQATIDGLAKKVGEKAINVAQALVADKPLSVYTKIALKELASNESITSGHLATVYQSTNKPNKDECYSKGTANAQAQQMMKLFPALGIATLDGKSLKVADTPQSQALQAIIAAAA